MNRNVNFLIDLHRKTAEKVNRIESVIQDLVVNTKEQGNPTFEIALPLLDEVALFSLEEKLKQEDYAKALVSSNTLIICVSTESSYGSGQS